jgi:hypothetical protein
MILRDFSYADMDMTDNQSPIYVSDHETNRRKKKKKKKKNKAKKNKRNRRNANRHAKELANITLNHPSLPTSHDHDEQRGAWVVGVSTSEIEALDANPDAGRNPSVEDTGHVSNKHKVEVAKRRYVKSLLLSVDNIHSVTDEVVLLVVFR